MTSLHGLSSGTVAQITTILRRFPAVHEAVLFGSRAKGVHKRGSDIDLALIGDGLTWKTLGQIEDALDGILLPYRFSLIAYNEQTDPEVAAHIQRVGYPIYQRKQLAVEEISDRGRNS